MSEVAAAEWVGRAEALFDLVREILRDQPYDIVDFAHQYFTALDEGTIEQWSYKGKKERFPIPPPRLTEEEYEAQMA